MKIKKFLILLLFCQTISYGQNSLSVKINESQIESALSVLVSSMSLNFGEINSNTSFTGKNWFVNIEKIYDVNITTDGKIIFKCDLLYASQYSFLIFKPNIVLRAATGPIICKIELVKGSNGHKLKIIPEQININDWAFDSDAVEIFLTTTVAISSIIGEQNLFVYSFPEMLVNFGYSLLPESTTNLFSDNSPYLSFTETEIALKYDTKADANVRIQNMVEGSDNIGKVGFFDNATKEWSDWYDSPITMPLPVHTDQKARTKSIFLLDNTSEATRLINWNGNRNNYLKESEFYVLPDHIQSAVFRKAVQASVKAKGDGDGELNVNFDHHGYTNSTPYTDWVSKYPSETYITAPVNYSVNNSKYQFFKWENGETYNKRTVSPVGSPYYTATYKGINLSDNESEYQNTSQRKTTRYSNGEIHKVYESLGTVWYEKSTDNGVTWQILNNGMPLAVEAKSPSVYGDSWGDPYKHYTFITYQKKGPSGTIEVILDIFKNGIRWTSGTSIAYDPYVAGIDLNYDQVDVCPNVVRLHNRHYIVAWLIPVSSFEVSVRYNYSTNPVANWERRIPGVHIRDGLLNDYYTGAFWKQFVDNNTKSMVVPYTEPISNLTMTCPDQPSSDEAFVHLAWQSGLLTPTIKYSRLRTTQNNQDDYLLDYNIGTYGVETASQGAGYIINKKPSFVVLNDNLPRLVWVGITGDNPNKTSYDTEQSSRLVLRGRSSTGWNSLIFKFGANIIEGMIEKNKTYIYQTAPEGYVFTFTNSANQKYYLDNTSYSSYRIKTFNNIGYGTQLCTADNTHDISLITKKSNSEGPYSFITEDCNFGNGGVEIGKENIIKVSSGRQGIVTKGNAGYMFTIGDITLNNENISFPKFDIFSEMNDPNSFLTSEEFLLDDNSVLRINCNYGLLKNSETFSVLSDTGVVKFKLELINGATNEVLGSHNIFQFDNNSLVPFGISSYEVDYADIRGSVKLRLTIDQNINGSISISDICSLDDMFAKAGKVESISLTDNKVTSYDISQNYPNPFNPATVINYQLPEAGNVSLKVYDVLGSEVATLVNAHQAEGRYEVKFDASHLSSGVYIYRIEAGKFVSTKKMMLLK